MRLHYLAGRREDRLVFDLQAALARELGFVDTPAKRASEQLMQRYYRAAKVVRQVNTILLQNLHARLYPAATRAGRRSTTISSASTSCSTCATSALFETRPGGDARRVPDAAAAPASCKGMTARTLRALWRNRHRIDAAFRRDPGNRARFIADLPRAARPHARAAADEPVRHPRPLPAGVRRASSARCSTTSSTSTRSTSTS